MSHTSAKSTSLVESDPDGSDLIPDQVLRPLETPQQVAGREKLCKRMPAVQSSARPSTFPNDLILAGKMGGMINKQKRALETVSIVGFNRLLPAWQGSPGNFDD